MMLANQLLEISYCWQVHDVYLVSLFVIAVINPYSLFLSL